MPRSQRLQELGLALTLTHTVPFPPTFAKPQTRCAAVHTAVTEGSEVPQQTKRHSRSRRCRRLVQLRVSSMLLLEYFKSLVFQAIYFFLLEKKNLSTGDFPSRYIKLLRKYKFKKKRKTYIEYCRVFKEHVATSSW